MVMEIEPLSDALGAKVTNLNLEKEVADSDLILLNEAFLKYHLLCIEAVSYTHLTLPTKA